MPFETLEDLISKSVEIGVQKILSERETDKNYISKSSALRQFGSENLVDWELQGKINPVKQGGLIKYNLQKLEKLSKIKKFQGDIIHDHVEKERNSISQSAAFKKYGRKTIERWVRTNEIIPVKYGNQLAYNIKELEKLSMVNELHIEIIERELENERS